MPTGFLRGGAIEESAKKKIVSTLKKVPYVKTEVKVHNEKVRLLAVPRQKKEKEVGIQSLPAQRRSERQECKGLPRGGFGPSDSFTEEAGEWELEEDLEIDHMVNADLIVPLFRIKVADYNISKTNLDNYDEEEEKEEEKDEEKEEEDAHGGKKELKWQVMRDKLLRTLEKRDLNQKLSSKFSERDDVFEKGDWLDVATEICDTDEPLGSIDNQLFPMRHSKKYSVEEIAELPSSNKGKYYLENSVFRPSPMSHFCWLDSCESANVKGNANPFSKGSALSVLTHVIKEAI